MANQARPLVEHAEYALRQYTAGDRLSCCLTPSCFAELQPQGGDCAVLTLQLSGERLEFAAALECQPIDVILKQRLVGPGPSRARPLVRTVPGFRLFGYGQALGTRGDLPMNKTEVMARFALRRLHA